MIFDVDISGDILIYNTLNIVDEHYNSWHTDTHLLDSNASQRKLSISIQLSDPNDYEGDLEFCDSNSKFVQET